MNVLIILALLTFSGKLVSVACEKIRLPSVVGMILLGVLIGPSFLGILKPDNVKVKEVYQKIVDVHKEDENLESLMEVFPKQVGYEIVHFMALIGVIILLFMAGLETDLRTFVRAGKVSFIVALGGAFVPLVLGFSLSLLFCPSINRALVIGAILMATSVSISVMSLMNLKKVQSREGTTILTAAIIDDVIGIVFLSGVLAYISGDKNELLISTLFIIGYLVAAIIFGIYIIPFIMNLSKKMNVAMGVNAAALSLMFFFAGAAEISNIAGITGAYLAGLFISRTPLKNMVREGMEVIGHSFFIPLFFIFIGLQINLSAGSYNWGFIVLFIFAAFVGKLFGAGIMAKISGFSVKSSFAIGSGMLPRGEVALIIASLGMKYENVLDAGGFTATVMLVIVTSLITPFLLSKGFKTKG